MKSNSIKFILICCVTFFSILINAQTAPDEDTGLYSTCTTEGDNTVRATDIPNPVNVGTIDDRSCYANYKESFVYNKTWGIYNITDGSNKFDTTLQPRIERSLSRSQETGVGSYARFTGTFRILEVGDTSGSGNDGTYIAQAKGKHTGGGGSADPAICLYLAKPIYGTGVNAGKQISFDIYAERILVRGGEGSGREIVFLKNVLKDVETTFELEVGFRVDPNDATKKIHYCDAVIGGTAFNWNIPEPERGTESGIRYGAYRVKGGRAQIRWANTTYQKAEVVDNGGSNPPPTEIYRLRNLVTGKFLTDSGVGATPVTMTDSGVASNTHWTFVTSGSYINIDSQTYGVLRAPGSSGPGGPFVVVSTATAPPSSDSDKVWRIYYNETEDTYRFEAGTSGRYLYHDLNGSVTNVSVPETDGRSIWEAISTSVSLSVSDKTESSSIKVYPNPAKENFTISFETSGKRHITVHDVLGKTVYSTITYKNRIELSKGDGFSSGVYLIKIQENGYVLNKKLVIN